MQNIEKEETVDLKGTLLKYAVHWKWFLLSVVLCLIVAFVYLRYAQTQYQATTTILVKDEKRGGISV